MSSLGRSYFCGVLHDVWAIKQVVVGAPSPTQSSGSRLGGFYPPATPIGCRTPRLLNTIQEIRL